MSTPDEWQIPGVVVPRPGEDEDNSNEQTPQGNQIIIDEDGTIHINTTDLDLEDCPQSPTSFQEMYDFFFAGITDDMFLEMTRDDTLAVVEELLLAALPHFEFPRTDIFDVDLLGKKFSVRLTLEEMMIIRQYMISEWLGYQLASVDLVRQKYSGSDFKFTSQASHLKQLLTLKQAYEQKGFHLQRLYCRRQRKNKGYGSTMAVLADNGT